MLWPAALKSREPRPGSLFFPPSPLFVLLKSDLSRHSSRQEIRPPLTGVLSPTASLGCRGEGGVGGSWPGRTRPPPPRLLGITLTTRTAPGSAGVPARDGAVPALSRVGRLRSRAAAVTQGRGSRPAPAHTRQGKGHLGARGGLRQGRGWESPGENRYLCRRIYGIRRLPTPGAPPAGARTRRDAAPGGPLPRPAEGSRARARSL